MPRRFGLRPRIALFAALIVGLALAAAAVLLVAVLHARLDDAASTAADLRARDIAALAGADALPARLALPGEESAFVQVVDEDGSVVASTENIEGEQAVSNRRPSADERLLLTARVGPLDNGEMRIAVLNANTGDGVFTIYAGESLSELTDTTSALIGFLVLGVPALALLVGAVTWWAVGRTLRPVGRITRTLTEITASDLHRRVPVPAVEDEIGELAVTVNATLERLDTSVETQRRFVADASHELRGPLAALRADLEISVSHPDRTEWGKVALDTLGDVERLEHLTDDLLLLALLDAHSSPPRHPVDLSGIVGEAMRSIRRTDVTVSAEGLDVAAVVSGNADQLRRMTRNLIHNAEQHARERIAVNVASADGVVRFIVSDDGPGIPTDQRRAVFERFVQLDTARTRDVGGTGLGLAIVADVVANHHGNVASTDGELGGATFVVEIPRATGGPGPTEVEPSPAATRSP